MARAREIGDDIVVGQHRESVRQRTGKGCTLIRVLHIFGRMVRAGAELRTVELMPLLAEHGVHCDVCTLLPGAGALDARIRALGGEVQPCPLRPRVLSFSRRFRRLLRHGDYDIVHSHVHYASGYMVCLAHRVGVKGRIVHFRSTGDGRPDTIRRALYRKIMRRLADKHATAIVAVSRAAMEHAWGARWQRDPRARVIYNGLDLTPFRDLPADTAEVRSELGVPRDGLLAINVGRIDPPKAHDVLLEAAAQVIRQEFRLHLLIVGDGSLRQEMQRKARDLNIHKNVHFLGIRDDVPRLLIASDCFVLSSRREGLPGALLEAIAARLPVVATDLPGIREVAEHTRLITMIPVEDPPALASALLGTLKRTGDRSAVPTPFPSVFDLQSCADNVHEMYLRALDREQTV